MATKITKWSGLHIKTKIAYVSAISAFAIGWILTIVGFILGKGQIHDSGLLFYVNKKAGGGSVRVPYTYGDTVNFDMSTNIIKVNGAEYEPPVSQGDINRNKLQLPGGSGYYNQITYWKTLSIYGLDGEKIRDYCPAIRVIDGAVGLYDLCGSISPSSNTPFYINSQNGGILPIYKLPKEYQQCRWLSSDGNAYIDTGIQGQDGLTFDLVAQYTNYIQYGALFGNYIDENHNTCRVILDNNQYIIASNNNFANTPASFGINAISRIILSPTKITTEYTSSNLGTNDKEENNTNIVLFAGKVNPPTIRNIGARLFYFSIIKDGVELRHFVPCYRKSDNKPGMYDITGSICPLTNSPFYINVGNSEFTVSSDLF